MPVRLVWSRLAISALVILRWVDRLFQSWRSLNLIAGRSALFENALLLGKIVQLDPKCFIHTNLRQLLLALTARSSSCLGVFCVS